jgi:hypothetical protein
MTAYAFLCGASLTIINPKRKEWAVKHLKKSEPTKPGFLKQKNSSPKLPRTWGRELFLLADKENRQRIWSNTFIANYYIIAIVGSMVCISPAICVVIFRNGTIILDVLAIIGYAYLIVFTLIGIIGMMYYLTYARKVLRPIHFSRLANKKLEKRNNKTEALKKQLPDPHYRIASLLPVDDAERLRIQLEADHPLTREQRNAAQAVIDAQAELEEAQRYAELTQAQNKPHTS